ncbi:o-succinylbenzoate synthase [Gilvibacter sediminis]|uniref:o-succinylbenzoate synthase n=1 Tax=Gilvibacter sediminis TaxID=379071 RepID=UPI00234FBD11|nr:o-succinylbenzoate synthase [Gilvibacter sediminis]MDC7997947.1 o-succinylbenzoate synthase [Gilvibacter sediminis]
MKASYQSYILDFKRPSGTSRGILTQKQSYFLQLRDGERWGIGECALLRGLSIDDRPDYEAKLDWLCDHINEDFDYLMTELIEFPSIRFGLEIALASLRSEDPYELFPSDFTQKETPIPINGLIWMGSPEFMTAQIEEKLEAGFDCIKMKIGAIDFEQELAILKHIRDRFDANTIELRVDANGAFAPELALDKLKRLAEFDLHSIEQPIKPKQWEAMATLCEQTPLPIALDEELIGMHDPAEQERMLKIIKPQYLIFKPSLLGGFAATDGWIAAAAKQEIPWWITSALESNIGLNAICQYTFSKRTILPQGLGTGSLYTNNTESPLVVESGFIRYSQAGTWNLNMLNLKPL